MMNVLLAMISRCTTLSETSYTTIQVLLQAKVSRGLSGVCGVGGATSGLAAVGLDGEEASAQLFERPFSGHWPEGASFARASPDGSDAGSPA